MSGNSLTSALQTAPIVIGFSRGAVPWAAVPGSVCWSAISCPLPLEERQLVFADLHLVAVLEVLRVDPAAVDVGAVQRAEVVEVPGVAAVDDDRVVARDRDVV